jgi:SAM-dependent methyltransferase
MPLDSRALEEFYDSRIGQVTRRLISRRLRQMWPDLSGQNLLGFGYAGPYLKSFGETERALAALPADECSPPCGNGKSRSALVLEDALPFPDASFDCLLVVHGLEVSEAQRPFLRELWRVLSASGRLLVVVPNRASLWAQLETTPFGQGRPYTRSQLGQLLEQSLFAAERWDSALFMPPFGRSRTVRTGDTWERFGHRMWPRLAGVHIVEATKSLYTPAPVKGLRRRVLKPALANPAQKRITAK